MPWYISRAGRVLGPIEDDALQQQLDAGDIGASDALARPGDAKWLPAARVFPEHFPGIGVRSHWLMAMFLVLLAPACWAGVAGLTMVYQRVADPGEAAATGLAILAACVLLLVLAGASLLWVRRRSGGMLGTGLKVMAGASLLAALPGLVLGAIALRNTMASDDGVDPHHLSINEQGEVVLVGGIGRTLAHDLDAVLVDHPGKVVLVLDNSGGMIDAAEATVELLRQRGPFTARVDGECASACALLLAAAERIELYSDSRIGLHRPSSVLGGDLGITDTIITSFIEQLSRAGFGAQALDAVREVPSEDMLWLEPTTHFGVLPTFQLLDYEGQEVAAELRDVVLARHLLALDMPAAADMLEMIHAAFPEHASQHSHALLDAYTRQDGIDEAMGRLLHAPFATALASTTPQAARAWLSNLVKLEDQFEWESPAGACYGHARHGKAKRAAMARASEVIRESAARDWTSGPAGNAPVNGTAPAVAKSRRWPLAYSATGPEAERECRLMISVARELVALPDHELLDGLADRLL